jgi:Tol biopolymer transport system component
MNFFTKRVIQTCAIAVALLLGTFLYVGGETEASAGEDRKVRSAAYPEISLPDLSACQAVTAVPGPLYSGVLEAGDCVDGNQLYDVYTVNAPVGLRLSAYLSSAAFAPFVMLADSNNNVLAANDGGGGQNARVPGNFMFITLTRTGQYQIVVTSEAAGGSGAYTLHIDSPGNCPITAIAFGDHVSRQTAEVCNDVGGYRIEIFSFNGQQGRNIAAGMDSAMLDPYLILADANGNILVEDDNGGGFSAARIPAGSSSFSLPATGNYLLFATDVVPHRFGAYGLWLADTAGPGDLPIIFTSMRTGEHEIYRMNENGSAVTSLGESPSYEDEAAWSPDGKRFVFYSTRNGSSQAGELHIANADGTGVVRLTDNMLRENRPAWSPDGTRIAFYAGSGDSSTNDIYVINADGTGFAQLTSGELSDTSPVWSPMGNKIAFACERFAPGDRDLCQMNADGTSVERILNNPAGWDEPLDWTAYGSKLLFNSTVDNNLDLFSVVPGGGNPARLTNHPNQDIRGSWSPDGRKVVFVRAFSDLNHDIFVLDTTTSSETQLTFDGLYDSWPDWQPGTSLTPVFDFDGDGKTDISTFKPGPGEWWYLRSSDGGNRAFQFGAGTDKLVPADYTGDGQADSAFYRNGEWFILRSNDLSFYSFPFGNSTDTPVPADYDGDGKADAAVYRASSGQWFIQRSSDGQVTVTGFGNSTDRPVPADLDGDGKADLAIFRPLGSSGMGEWWYLRSSDGTNRAFAFGQSTDKTVVGDYTGDGKADIAFFRPSTGVWFVLRSEDLSFYSFPFGTGTDIPAPGDYDGDGRTDPAVFRPSDTNWYVLRSTAGILIQQFGAATDKPVPGTYVR